MSRIRTISPKDPEAKEELQDAYKQLGPASYAHILQLQSLHAQAMVKHFEFYKVLMYQESPLSRSFREMIAFSVSKWNGCHY